MKPTFSVLYEDNHLLVVNKSAQLATMGVSDEEPSLVKLAKDYLKRKYNKPGKVYLGIVSRLDSFVTGAIVLARTSKAASRLTRQFSDGAVTKIYWALVEQPPQPADGGCIDWVRKDDERRRMVVCDPHAANAKEARLRYRTMKGAISVPRRTALEVELQTGRKHQIRVQLADRGWPVIGDRKYGSQVRFPSGIALHSRRLAFQHPVGERQMDFVAPLPGYWPQVTSSS